MNKYTINQLLVFLLLLIAGQTFAQSMSGYVLNQSDEGIPYVNIFVRQTQSGTTTDDNGYYFLTLNPGEYDVVLSSIGFETQTSLVIIDEAEEVNFKLTPSDYELAEITIKASKKDPAYEIIQNAIDNRKSNQSKITSLRSQVYMKALEVIDIQSKKKKEEKLSFDLEGELDEDPFEASRREKEAEMNKLNLLEMQMVLNYQYPDKYKEERTGYKLYGSKDGLFVPRFDEVDFDFYDNMVSMRAITETPLVSPIARTSILSYKYKLISSVQEGDYLVHKIKVIPRKSGNSTVTGFIYINEGTWNINRLEFTMSKGSMKLFDELSFEVSYEEEEDDTWAVTRISMDYLTKVGKRKKYEGKTLIKYSDLQINYPFPEKFFGSEVASITQEAYDRDSLYWNQTRPEALSTKEKELVIYKDSIEAIHNSKEYKDSIDLDYNKIQLWEILYEGVGFRNHTKKQSMYIAPLASLLNFDVVGGFRFGPYYNYFRRFDSGRTYRTSTSFNIGEKNRDFNGWTNHWLRYDPFRLGDISFHASRSFRAFNTYDAYLNQLQASNYYLQTNYGVRHSIEVVNGFYVSIRGDWSNRSDISHLERGSFLNEFIPEEQPITFDPYQTFITNLTFTYTPFQKYMKEPNRKVVLGSKWPTFAISHKKGWNGPLSSDIDFDFIEMSVTQDLILGVFGNSKYKLLGGTYVNDTDVRLIDVKWFRQSDPLLYSDPLNNFQVLDTSLISTNPFVEFHWIHHFNGALVNNIPLIKKTRIAVVLGGGFLYVSDQNYNHQEIFAGLERVFKIGPRRRVRLGVYGVVGESNQAPTAFEYKFSIDVIDTWKRDWSF